MQEPDISENNEILTITVIGDDAKSIAYFDRFGAQQNLGAIGLLFLCFDIFVWFLGLLFFAGPVTTLVVIPIERMIRLLNMLVRDPLGYDSTENFYRFTSEEEEIVKYSCWTNRNLKGMETMFLMNTIIRIGSLMKVGYGAAGVEIIRASLRKNSKSSVTLRENQKTVTEERTKGTDGRDGDTGSALVTHCNYCLLTITFVLANSKEVIECATKKLQGSDSRKFRLSLDFAFEEVKRKPNPNNENDPSLIDDKTKQACRELNQAIHDFVKNGKGGVYMSKNPGCSSWDYICDEMNSKLIMSLMKSCGPEMKKVRGLQDCKDRCQCSPDCQYFLPVDENERCCLPVLNGESIPVAKCCLYRLVWKNDIRIPSKLQPEKNYIQGCMQDYDENNPKWPKAIELCTDGKIDSIEGFFSADRNKNKYSDLNDVKNRLGFFLTNNKAGKRSNYSSRKTCEENRAYKNAMAFRVRDTMHYQSPDNRFLRTMRGHRYEVINDRHHGVSECKMASLLLNASKEFVAGYTLQTGSMFLLDGEFEATSVEELQNAVKAKTQGDEIIPCAKWKDFALMLHVLNFQHSPGTVNQQKSIYTTTKCVITYISLLKTFNVKPYGEVLTREQGQQYAIENRDELKIMFDECHRFMTDDINRDENISKDEVTRLIAEAGLPELELPLIEEDWSDLSEEEQTIQRLKSYKVIEEYYKKWAPNGYGATVARQFIDEIEGVDRKKPVASST